MDIIIHLKVYKNNLQSELFYMTYTNPLVEHYNESYQIYYSTDHENPEYIHPPQVFPRILCI